MDVQGTQIGDYAPDFELPGVDRSVHHLACYLEQFRAIAVVVMCNHCPYVRTYLNCLKQIQADYHSHGFTLVGINGNDDKRYPEDSFDNMRTFAQDHHLNFPYLRDTTQDVIRSLGAVCTPEVFLLDHRGVLRYRGAVDDGGHQLKTYTHYLRDAIAQVLEGHSLSLTLTPAVGCSIKWRS